MENYRNIHVHVCAPPMNSRNHVLHITTPESAASRFLLPSRPVYYQSISVDLTQSVPAPAQHQTTDAEVDEPSVVGM